MSPQNKPFDFDYTQLRAHIAECLSLGWNWHCDRDDESTMTLDVQKLLQGFAKVIHEILEDAELSDALASTIGSVSLKKAGTKKISPKDVLRHSFALIIEGWNAVGRKISDTQLIAVLDDARNAAHWVDMFSYLSPLEIITSVRKNHLPASLLEYRHNMQEPPFPKEVTPKGQAAIREFDTLLRVVSERYTLFTEAIEIYFSDRELTEQSAQDFASSTEGSGPYAQLLSALEDFLMFDPRHK